MVVGLVLEFNGAVGVGVGVGVAVGVAGVNCEAGVDCVDCADCADCVDCGGDTVLSGPALQQALHFFANPFFHWAPEYSSLAKIRLH